MSYTLIDYFKGFHDVKQAYDLSANAQAVYFTLLGEFNAARFPEQLSISDRELMSLSGVKSVSTIHDAKRILKNIGLIDFKTSRAGTVYRLCSEHLPNSRRTPPEQREAVPIIRARADVKTLDSKEEDARPREKNLSEVWTAEMHRPLGASERYELSDLEEQHGYEVVKAAIVKTRHSRCYPTFDDFKAILFAKGDDTNEKRRPAANHKRISRPGESAAPAERKRRYKLPDTSKDPEDLYSYL